MQTLKKMIRIYMYRITCILVIVIVGLLLCIQLITEQNRACETGARTISQIKSILEENHRELSHIFTHFRVNPEASYYAIDAESGEIVGASDLMLLGHHTEEGAAILEEIYNERKKTQFSDLAISIARYHHERWDGMGPHKLKGNEIPLEARIVTLVDVFDVLRSNQNHTDVHSIEESIEIINGASGKVFDPEIVKVFNKMWKQLHT